MLLNGPAIIEPAPFDDISYDLCRAQIIACLLYTSPSPRDRTRPRMPSSA